MAREILGQGVADLERTAAPGARFGADALTPAAAAMGRVVVPLHTRGSAARTGRARVIRAGPILQARRADLGDARPSHAGQAVGA